MDTADIHLPGGKAHSPLVQAVDTHHLVVDMLQLVVDILQLAVDMLQLAVDNRPKREDKEDRRQLRICPLLNKVEGRTGRTNRCYSSLTGST